MRQFEKTSFPENLIRDLFHTKAHDELQISDETKAIVLERLNSDMISGREHMLICMRYRKRKTFPAMAAELGVSRDIVFAELGKVLETLRTGNLTYRKLSDKHEKQVSDLPMHFAFGRKQFNEMMLELGLDPENDKDKLCRDSSMPGAYFLKTDVPTIRAAMRRMVEEKYLAMQSPRFLRGALEYELANHEYCITMDESEAIYACGLSYAEFERHKWMRTALAGACRTARRT